MSDKKVLIITYYFPPRPSVASLRLKGLAKYLPEFGWEPVILTAALPGVPDQRFKVIETNYPGDITAILKKRLGLYPDKRFQEQIGILSKATGRKRFFTNKLVTIVRELFIYPDDQKKWYPFAIRTGMKIVMKENFDAIISSSAPVTTHLVAKYLKENYNIPWLADFRDLWTQNYNYQYGFLRKWFEKKLEVNTILQANALVTVSKPLASKLRILHSRKPIFTIMNGFDLDEINEAPINNKKFTITYTGNLYYGKQDPELLLKAIRELTDESIVKLNDVRINFYGPTQYWLSQKIKKYDLDKIVKQHGTVPREIALKSQRESQILLILGWNDPKERGTYSGKIFEYLAAKRPVLAIGEYKGVLNKLLEETNAGYCFSNIKPLKYFITRCYKEYKMKGEVQYYGKISQIKKYSHYEMAKNFANVLDGIVINRKFNNKKIIHRSL